MCAIPVTTHAQGPQLEEHISINPTSAQENGKSSPARKEENINADKCNQCVAGRLLTR